MKNALKTHGLYYLTLVLMLIVGFMLIMVFHGQPGVQMIAIMLVTFVYVLWGILHHVFHHNISTKIVVEYVLIASLGMVLTWLVIR